MTTATITETLEMPGGTAAATVQQTKIRLRLVATTDSGEAFGYADTADASVGGERWARPNGAGTYSFANVRPNSGDSGDVITRPSGTVYELVIAYPRRPAVTRYVRVPDSAGPHQVADILTVAPSAVATDTDIPAQLDGGRPDSDYAATVEVDGGSPSSGFDAAVDGGTP